ncbi:DUF4424 family protein [Mangrovibrevibacter kandeliae]|uniref:DUF4424 family protein n=1 Tax=Mangrovibrevibacter kandeliae TaxID=2968473 RepID=UPI0021177D7D|nr:DUF4424 domain-containing protein [Aurantimonas sp. CSK15Z-1]
MRSFILPLLSISILITVHEARANDSAAEQAAGGLELVEAADVAMKREDLTITPDRIDVHYVFENESDEDQTLTVAFPLPPIEGDLAMTPLELPVAEVANFVGFTVSVDGRMIRPAVEERAFVGDREVTQELQRLRIPLNPMAAAVSDALAGLGKKDYARLEKAGIVTERDMASGLWRYEVRFHWEQTFPAHREVVVDHRYRPVRGSYFVDRYSLEEDPDYAAKYCVDAGTRKALRNLILQAAKDLLAEDPDNNANLNDDPMSALGYSVVVPYILTTANNWAGPIGTFHLTIDKGAPTNIVSLCRDGIKKTGPTRFEWSATNFSPKRDLLVLFAAKDAAAFGLQ